MSDDQPPDVLHSLPHSRTHRRSARRPTRSDGEPAPSDGRADVPGDEHEPNATADADGAPLLAIAVQTAAELAEICLSLSARAIRAALARLPRP